ncbi:MAG TPA: hypothetical protein VM425_01930 [Myxococcota bacterium]|nr:hypothetical protein [Myxococcota bacterium]
MLAALASHLWIILLDLLLLGAAASLGLWALPVKRQLSALESLAVAVALGLTGLSLFVFVLSAWHVLAPWWLLLFILLAWVSGLSRLNRLVFEIAAQWRVVRKQLHAFDIGIIAVCAVLLLYPFLGSLMPPLGWDALVYHLYNARVYIAHGGFVRIPFDFYSNLPMNFDLLFAGGMLLGSDRLPALLHFSTGSLALLGMLGFAARRFSPRAGLIACLLLLVSPVVLETMSTAYIDMGVAFALLALFICLWEWAAAPEARWALPSGMLAGFVIGAKLTAAWYVIIGVGLAVAVARYRGLRLSVLTKSLLWMFGPCVILLAPWMAKAYLLTGNPLFPLLTNRLGAGDLGPPLIADMFAWLRSVGRGRGFGSSFLALWNVFFESRDGVETAFLGKLSPLPLVMFALAWIRWRRKALVNLVGVAALLLFYAWFFCDPQEDRFLLPALIPFCLLGGLAFDALPQRLNRLSAGVFSAVILIFVAQTMIYLSPAFHGAKQVSARYLAGGQTAEDYLATRCRPYRSFRYVEKQTGKSEPVALFFENLAYYLDRPNLSDDFFQASVIISLAHRAGRPEALARLLADMGIEYIVVNHDNLEAIERVAGDKRQGSYGKKHLAGIAIIKQLLAEYCREEYRHERVAVYRIMDRPPAR